MRILFNLIFILFSIVYIPALLFKGKFHRSFIQRFAVYTNSYIDHFYCARRMLWIHAVSVGEIQAAIQLVRRIREEVPHLSVVVSTTTRTGNHLAKKSFPKDIKVIYFPLDFSAIVKRAVSAINPSLFAMVETEIWPNLVMELSGRGIPMVLLNGRISDSSFRGYMLARRLMGPVLSKITRFSMQTERDAERIKAIGAGPESVVITGNMKFDMAGEAGVLDGTARADLEARIRKGLIISPDEDVIIAGSTHTGEEKTILKAYLDLMRKFPNLRLIIAPRHTERSGQIECLAKKFRLRAVKVSYLMSASIPEERKIDKSGHRAVLILDTIGQLKDLYSIAAIVFVGGSLVAKGGHNPIEPAIFARPVISGPHTFNFRDIYELFVENGAAVIVNDRKELKDVIEALLVDPQKNSAIGEASRALVLKNMGATDRNVKILKELLMASPERIRGEGAPSPSPREARRGSGKGVR